MDKGWNNRTTFKDYKELAAKGRTRVGPFGKGRYIYYKTYCIYHSGSHERIAIRYYSTDLMNIYPDESVEIMIRDGVLRPYRSGEKARINAHLFTGQVELHKRIPYFVHAKRWYPMTRNKNFKLISREEKDGKRILLPENHENLVCYAIDSYLCNRHGLGKRWHVDFDFGGKSCDLIHRCNNGIRHATILGTSICSACKENVLTELPNFEEKIRSMRDFLTLKEKLGQH